jgi:hypothetical protein
MMSRIKDISFNVFLAAIFFYAVVVGYWLWWPYIPLVVENPIKVMNLNKQVMAGDDLVYKITYEKKMNVQGVLTRKLVNTYKHDLRESITTAPIGPDKDMVSVPIPKMAEPGDYTLWWSVAYKVNPLRTVTVCAESEKFQVIANPDKGRGARGYPGSTGARGSKGDKGDKGGFSIFPKK